jgi:Tol biopolymer transport system component
LLAARQATWQVHIMRPDGMDKRQLTASARYSLSPQVSPDGEWVAYVDTWYEYDKSELRKVRVDGTEDTLLHPHGWLPVWSPDGEQLAFLEAKRNLAVMAPDGSDLRLLGSLAVREPVWIVRGRPDHFYGLLLAGGGMMAGAPLLAIITSR